MQRLQKVQNSAARTLTGQKRREHITPVLYKLHWLPMRRRSQYKYTVITYKAVNGLGPKYLEELLKHHQPVRSLRSADEHLLQVPLTRLTTGGDRAFEKVAPTLWNDLPLSLRTSSSLQGFKKSLKTHLFKLEYGNVN